MTRFQGLNAILLSLIVAYGIFINAWLQTFPELHVTLRLLITLVTSVFSYSVLLSAIIWCIDNNSLLLKLYYNSLYLDGLWSYTYNLDGEIYFGIWHIHQTVSGTSIKGYGIDKSGANRSDVRSVTDLIPNNGAYDIINVRQDVIETGKDYYSKTTINPIYNSSKSVFRVKYPKKLWGRTEIYGGKLSGNKHTNLHFSKHETIADEEELKALLLESHGG